MIVLTVNGPHGTIDCEAGWPAGSLMERLAPHLRRTLLGSGRPQRSGPRKVLLHQGNDDRHVLLLTDGVVKISVTDETGSEAVLALRRRGDVVGELAAITGERRSASVETVVPVTARVIPGLVFNKFVEDHPPASRELIRMEAHRLRWANQRRAEFARLDARSRLARTLLELEEVFHQGCGTRIVTLSQAELASLVGVRLATAEVALRELQERGAIEKRYRAITVHEARLRAEVLAASARRA